MKIFMEGRLSDVLENQKRSLRSEIHSFQRDYLLNANETELVQFLLGKYRIEPLVIHEDRISAADREVMVPAERFRFEFNFTPGRAYSKQAICYHVPVSGDLALLKYAPSSRLLWSHEVELQGNEIVYQVINWRDDAAELKREWEQFIDNLKTQAGHSASEVNGFNNRLEQEIVALVQVRKQEVLKKASLLASLGVPLKKDANVPGTFAVPAPKKKAVVKPSASTAPFRPEPTLDDTTYQDILKILHDTGVEIERHPSIYEGKDEETLRDHFLMVLAPHFNSVTGETFNKVGKTDILIRHEGQNLFVAECGIWKGAKNFLGKIDQLLSYLTWRDSKTALVCFVKNKEFTSVLETIQAEVKTHASFIKEEKAVNEAWLRYEFALKEDRGRSVRMAVLCFHFPG